MSQKSQGFKCLKKLDVLNVLQSKIYQMYITTVLVWRNR